MGKNPNKPKQQVPNPPTDQQNCSWNSLKPQKEQCMYLCKIPNAINKMKNCIKHQIQILQISKNVPWDSSQITLVFFFALLFFSKWSSEYPDQSRISGMVFWQVNKKSIHNGFSQLILHSGQMPVVSCESMRRKSRTESGKQPELCSHQLISE